MYVVDIYTDGACSGNPGPGLRSPGRICPASPGTGRPGPLPAGGAY